MKIIKKVSKKIKKAILISTELKYKVKRYIENLKKSLAFDKNSQRGQIYDESSNLSRAATNEVAGRTLGSNALGFFRGVQFISFSDSPLKIGFKTK